MNNFAHPRLLSASVERAAAVMPVVVVTGARQTGKSTLVRELLDDDRTYLTLDDLGVRSQAQLHPEDLLGRASRLTLDEVQRAPDLLIEIKKAVDEDRRAGRFLLTGSANLLLMERISESLAGRASYVTLWPLTRREALGRGEAGAWSNLFDRPFNEWSEVMAGEAEQQIDWRELVRRGGFPTPALEMVADDDRAIWFEGYVRTYLERDLQDLSSVDRLVDFGRLMSAACLRIAQLVNQTELGRDVQLPQPTVRRWLNLLETSYQLVRLPAFSVNRTKRLIKTPKIYWCDAGLAFHLARIPEPTGAHLENLILSDLVAWRDSKLTNRPMLSYWRTTTGEEVDFVLESGRELVAVEVKATTKPRVSDARGLRSFRDEYAKETRGCLLLHCGTRIETLAPGVLATPWWTVV